MQLKFVYKDEIHRCTKKVHNLENLLVALKEVFDKSLPEHFTLQYSDAEGDRIMIINEDDFESMVQSEGDRTVKIYINSTANSSAVGSFSDSSVTALRASAQLQSQVNSVPQPDIYFEELKHESQPQAQVKYDPQPDIYFEDMKASSKSKSDFKSQAEVAPQPDIHYKPSSPVYVPSSPQYDSLNKAPKEEEDPRLEIVHIKPQEPEQKAQIGTESLIKEHHQEVGQVANAQAGELSSSIKKAENDSRDVDVGQDLEAKVRLVTLKTIQEHLDLIAGAVRTNVLKSQEQSGPVSTTTVIESLIYIQKLTQKIEGASQESITKLNADLSSAIDSCRAIEAEKEAELERERQAAEKRRIAEEEELAAQLAKEEVARKEKKNREIEQNYRAKFIGEISQIPSKLTTADMTVNKTISIRNTGALAFPKDTYLKCFDLNVDQHVALPQIQAGKEYPIVLNLPVQPVPGVYTSTWEIRTNLPGEGVFTISDAIQLQYSVVKHEEPKPEQSAHSDETRRKAREIKDIFPQYSIDDICEYVSLNPDKGVEELVAEYMSLHNSISN